MVKMNLQFREHFKENAEMNKINIYYTKPKNIIDKFSLYSKNKS